MLSGEIALKNNHYYYYSICLFQCNSFFFNCYMYFIFHMLFILYHLIGLFLYAYIMMCAVIKNNEMISGVHIEFDFFINLVINLV